MKSFFYRIFLYLIIAALLFLNFKQWTNIQNYKSDLYGKEVYTQSFQSMLQKYKLLLKINKDIKEQMKKKHEKPKTIIKFKIKYKDKNNITIPDLKLQLVKTNKGRWYIHSNDPNVQINDYTISVKPNISIWVSLVLNFEPEFILSVQYEKWIFGAAYRLHSDSNNNWALFFSYRIFQW